MAKQTKRIGALRDCAIAFVLALAMVPTPAFAYFGNDSKDLRAATSTLRTQDSSTITCETDVGTWTCTLYTNVPNRAWNNKVYIDSFAPKNSQIVDTLEIPSSVDGHDVYGITNTSNSPFDPHAKSVEIPANISVQGLTSDTVTSLILGANSGHPTNGFSTQGLPNLTTLELGDGSYFKSANESKKLTSVTLGKDINFIPPSSEKGCFESCTALTSVQGSLSAIPHTIFKGCSGLSTFDFAGVTSIGTDAFKESGLTGELKLPDCTSIGGGAFYGTKITSVEFGKAFSVPERIHPLFGKPLETVKFAGSVNNSNTGLFVGAELKTIEIGSGVESLGMNTFAGSLGTATVTNNSASMKTINSTLKNPNGIQVYPYLREQYEEINSINASRLFSSQDGILTIPTSVQSIQPESIQNLAISSFTVEDGNVHFKVGEDGILYSADGKTLYKAPNTMESVQVPEGVTEILYGAFRGNTNLTSVTVPASTKTISPRAFEDCTNLASVTLAEGVNVLGDYAFSDCTALTSLKLPDSITDIGNGTFEGLQFESFSAGPALWTSSAVKSRLSDFVAEGAAMTANMLWFGEAWAADGLGEYGADRLNTSVKALDFSRYQSTFIPHYAFAGLTGISEVSLPASVQEVGNGAFYLCKNLKDVYVYNPSAIQISRSSGGQGDSGSGNKDESYAVTQPGSFSWWNPDRQSDSAGTGSKYEDYTGLNFYGYANDNNALVKFCKDMGHSFIPVVALGDIAAADNPFATGEQAEFGLTYGTGDYDYSSVAVADITVGETPKVVASFGSKTYSGGGGSLQMARVAPSCTRTRPASR